MLAIYTETLIQANMLQEKKNTSLQTSCLTLVYEWITLINLGFSKGDYDTWCSTKTDTTLGKTLFLIFLQSFRWLTRLTLRWDIYRSGTCGTCLGPVHGCLVLNTARVVEPWLLFRWCQVVLERHFLLDSFLSIVNNKETVSNWQWTWFITILKLRVFVYVEFKFSKEKKEWVHYVMAGDMGCESGPLAYLGELAHHIN